MGQGAITKRSLATGLIIDPKWVKQNPRQAAGIAGAAALTYFTMGAASPLLAGAAGAGGATAGTAAGAGGAAGLGAGLGAGAAGGAAAMSPLLAEAGAGAVGAMSPMLAEAGAGAAGLAGSGGPATLGMFAGGSSAMPWQKMAGMAGRGLLQAQQPQEQQPMMQRPLGQPQPMPTMAQLRGLPSLPMGNPTNPLEQQRMAMLRAMYGGA